MASIVPTITTIGSGNGSVKRVVWTPITEADSCVAAQLVDFADKSIQAFGTFGSATVALHGSNDGGVTYAALNTPVGTAIALTAAGIKAVLENTEYVKPVMTGGTSQSLTIALVARLANPLRT